MQEHVDIDVLANWVTMLRAGVDGAILLVDDDDEARFYERCVHEKAQVVPATGVALALLNRMEQRGVHGVVAACRGEPCNTHPPNVFQPDLGDVASILLMSESSQGVLTDVCGTAWLKACEKETGPVCQRAAWIARIVSHIRQAANASGDPMSDGAISRIIEWSRFDPDWNQIPNAIQGASAEALDQARLILPQEDLRSTLAQCDGVHVIAILAMATQMYHPRGLSAATTVKTNGLLGMFRVAFDLNNFEKDEVFWRMRLWERTDGRYPLLRRWRFLDPLGVVLDQRYWESDLEVMLKMLKPGETLAMFKLDLDNFKGVNDALGHVAGDAAIRFYCELVKGVLGPIAEIYRRGGDEVLAIAQAATESRARDLAEKLRAAIETEFKKWASERNCSCAPTASIGLAFAKKGASKSEVARVADEAQQQAKQQGKNRVFVLSS